MEFSFGHALVLACAPSAPVRQIVGFQERRISGCNSKGDQIAASVADLHSAKNGINKETALDERGMSVKGRGDTPNTHDMLTGTQQDGTVVPGSDVATCSNWTSSAEGKGSAVVGHHDLIGNTQGPNLWNYSHKTPGCSPANLQKVGGAGLFYCFAVN
jgi:hypothetical protein